MPWYLDSDQLVTIDGLADPVTGTYVNTATITVTMYQADGTTQVTGQSWPLTLSYVSSSNGNYRGMLEDTRVLEEGKIYWLDVEADAGGGLIKSWRWYDVARYRTPADD